MLMFKVNVKHFIGKNLIGIFDLKVNVDVVNGRSRSTPLGRVAHLSHKHNNIK
jgi:hypothetical protein